MQINIAYSLCKLCEVTRNNKKGCFSFPAGVSPDFVKEPGANKKKTS